MLSPFNVGFYILLEAFPLSAVGSIVSPLLTLFYKRAPTLQSKGKREALHCTLQLAEETTRL